LVVGHLESQEARAAGRGHLQMNRLPDFYVELGITRSATTRQIRSAFRRLAMVHHPDRHADPAAKARAEERFKAAAEAYRVLSSPERRRLYDAHHRSVSRRPSRAEAVPHPAGLVIDLLEAGWRLWGAWVALEARRMDQMWARYQRFTSSFDELIRVRDQFEKLQHRRRA
jgi:curved DNA-binding protein CbpA